MARVWIRATTVGIAFIAALLAGADRPVVLAARQAAAGAEAGRVASLVRALGGTAAEADAVGWVYRSRAGAMAWTSYDGLPTGAASVMRARFDAAATHGLDPGAYLRPEVAAALGGSQVTGEVLLTRDVAVTLATLRYMRHLHLGRVDPRRLGLRLQTWAEPHDFSQLLSDALERGSVGAVVDGLAPPYRVYGALAAELTRYRTLAAQPLPAVPGVTRTLRQGDVWPGVTALAGRLVAMGDLDASAVPPPDATVYVGPVVAAVRRFQARHGLTADGAIGARTVAALQVPLTTRVQQIELALERLRWLPDLGRRRVVMVNIPMFRLWAWEAGQLDQPPARSIEVIVGRAMRHETPVFIETMTHLIFRPYWNVPRSIVRNEVLPAIGRNPRYLASQQMEIVQGPGDDARVVPADADTVAALAAGTLRLRQRPGSHNALGLVKFVFPNHESVYMHGTPSQALFARDRRDFSHGCIRVADPPGLASWALTGVPGWHASRIAGAMAVETSEQVDVAEPIDVVLFYMTASVGPDSGALHFADDIYGHDLALGRALGRH